MKKRFQEPSLHLCLALLATILIAPRPWLAQPLVSVPLVVTLFVALLARNPRPWLLAASAWLLLRTLPDRMLWQPYLLQYIAMLVACANRNAQRLILVCIYFWSGFAKLHCLYMDAGATVFLHPPFADLPHAVRLTASIAIPFVELGLALALLVPRTRRVAVVGLTAMHMLILATIGPFGTASNRVIWPWNLANIALLWTLFREREPSAREIFWPRRWHRAWLVLFGICPGLSYLGAWDPYLSFRLYARRDWQGYVFLTEAGVRDVPAELAPLVKRAPLGEHVAYLELREIVEQESGILPPPVPTVMKSLGRRLLAPHAATNDWVLAITEPPDWRTGERRRRLYTFAELTRD